MGNEILIGVIADKEEEIGMLQEEIESLKEMIKEARYFLNVSDQDDLIILEWLGRARGL